jgi:DNA primase small subunit
MRTGIMRLIQELEAMGPNEARNRLQAIEGVGEKTANGIYNDLFGAERGSRGVDRMRDEENLEVFSENKHLKTFLDIVKGEISVKVEGERDGESLSVKDRMEGETDEPVTSDIKRLIRLPSSLHGKTGMRVTILTREELDDFEPLSHAFPEAFTSESVAVDIQVPVSIKLRNETFDLKEGVVDVPEYAAVYLMCRGAARLALEN